MEHLLNIDQPYLKAKLAGEKLFEIRINDRGYQKGDKTIYHEYPDDYNVTRHIYEVTYVTGYNQMANHVVFGEKYLRSERLNHGEVSSTYQHQY